MKHMPLDVRETWKSKKWRLFTLNLRLGTYIWAFPPLVLAAVGLFAYTRPALSARPVFAANPNATRRNNLTSAFN